MTVSYSPVLPRSGRLVRRRFHADLPGPVFQGEGYRLSAPARHRNCDPPRSTPRSASASALLETPTTTPTTRRIFIRYTGTSSSRWAASGPRPRRVRAGDLPRMGGVPPLRALRRRAAGAASACASAGLRLGLISNTHRSLESFQQPFRARRADRRRGVVVRARLQEAAPEHLPRGAAAARRVAPEEAVMVGDSYRTTSRARGRSACTLPGSGGWVRSSRPLPRWAARTSQSFPASANCWRWSLPGARRPVEHGLGPIVPARLPSIPLRPPAAATRIQCAGATLPLSGVARHHLHCLHRRRDHECQAAARCTAPDGARYPGRGPVPCRTGGAGPGTPGQDDVGPGQVGLQPAHPSAEGPEKIDWDARINELLEESPATSS